MKIGILSMQRVDNIGSLLQAYALKCMLNKLGLEVSFVDIEPRPEENKVVQGAVYDYRKESDKGKRLDRYVIYRLINKMKCQKQRKVYEDFRRIELGISDASGKKQWDACVIGSDEVFNCLSPSPWGFTSQLFGNVYGVSNIITYAASCGATTYDDLPESARNIIRDSFAYVRGFSGRDSNTVEFIKKLGGTDVKKHFDPVLIYDFKEEIRNYTGIADKLPQRYCILYSYQNRIHKSKEIHAIKEFCKTHKFNLISIGQSQYWLPCHMVMHPFEVINAFMNAEYVITDTFHGCILASKYSKDFSVMIQKSNENKILDFVRTINVEEYVIKSMTNLAIHNIGTKVTIQTVLGNEAKRTEEYLREILLCKKH